MLIPKLEIGGKQVLTLSQTNRNFLCVCSTSLLKTLWEKEKLLVMSDFSFSYSVFYPSWEFSAIFIKFNIGVCIFSVWKSLKFVVREWDNSLPHNPDFLVLTTLKKKPFENIVGKGENAGNQSQKEFLFLTHYAIYTYFHASTTDSF